MDGERAKGPVLLVDAGNALFPTESAPDAQQKKRAELLLKSMGGLATAALAAGARDLSAGTGFLKSMAHASGLPVLSANLETAGGSHPFPASRTLQVGALRVALIGASPEGKFPGAPELHGAPLVPAVLAEARRLRQRSDVVIVLAAAPFNQAIQLAQAADGQVDFILQSHDSRGVGSGSAIAGKGCFVVSTGERGRQVGEMALVLQGKRRGSFVDLDEHQRIEASVKVLEESISLAKTRLAGAPDEATKKALSQSLAGFQSRLANEQQRIGSAPEGAGNGFHLKFQLLGPEIPDAPELRHAVEALQPGAFAQPT